MENYELCDIYESEPGKNSFVNVNVHILTFKINILIFCIHHYDF